MKATHSALIEGLFAIGLVLVVFSPPAWGYENQLVSHVVIGPGDARVLLNETHFTTPIPTNDVDRMQENLFFAAMSDSEVQQYVFDFRRYVVQAIELIKGEDLEKGDGLEYMYRSDSLCMGLPPADCTSDGECLADGERGVSASDAINLYPCSLEEGSYCLPRFYITLSRLGDQCSQTDSLSDDPTPQEEAVSMAAQHGIYLESLNRIGRLSFAVNTLLESNEIPPSVTGAPLLMCRSLQDEGDQGVITSWSTFLHRDQLIEGNVATRFASYQRCAQLAADGNPDYQVVLSGLRIQSGAACRSASAATCDAVYLSDPPVVFEFPGFPTQVVTSSNLRVYNPCLNASQNFSISGVNAISDLYRLPDRLIVSAVNTFSGQGRLVSFPVDLSTGLVNISAQTDFVDSLFDRGVELCSSFETGTICGVSRGTGECYVFDPSLTSHTPGGYLVPPRSSLGITECSFADSQNLVCSSYPLEISRGFESNFEFAVNVSFPFSVQPVAGIDSGLSTSIIPTFFYPPYQSTGCVEVCGTPGRTFSVTAQVGGGTPSVVATGLFGLGSGRCTVDLGPPPNSSTNYHLVDAEGRTSAGVTSYPRPAIPRLSFVRGSDGDIDCSSEWKPGTGVSFVQSDTLGAGSFNNVIRSDQATRGGLFYAKVPSFNTTNSGNGFFRAQTPTASITPPVATADSFVCTAGLTQTFDCSANDEGCPLGTYYELVSPPGLPEGLFDFASDGSCQVTMLNFLGGLTFSYRPIYQKVAGPAVECTLTEDSDALTNPREYSGVNEDPWVQIPCFFIDGEYFPLYQFYLRPPEFGGGCFFPHWHWRFGAPVYSFENPTTPVNDPNPPGCGFGIFGTIPIVLDNRLRSDWTAFLNDHP